jgi:hypothetical protein
MGESQSGGYITRYYNWIHDRARLGNGEHVYDGYLIEDSGTAPSSSAILNQCAAALAATDPQRNLAHHAEPLAVVNSEVFYPRTGRPPNSDTPDNKFMLWMTAGASHGWTFQYDYSDAAKADLIKAGFLTPDNAFPHFVCSPAQPEINLYMVEKVMYIALDRWVAKGIAPPAAPDPQVVNGQYVRDANGNVVGGVRLPEMQVPIARYTGVVVPSADCTSAVRPFAPDLLAQLYPTHKAYARVQRRRSVARARRLSRLPGRREADDRRRARPRAELSRLENGALRW